MTGESAKGVESSVHLVTGEEAIQRHAPFDWKTRYGVDAADQLLESSSTHPHVVSVFAVDVRRSTFLALETDPPVFARIMKEFIDFSWAAVRSLGGWFDKFTGDGFLAYRPHGSHVDGDWDPSPKGEPPPTLAGIIFLADYVARYFEEAIRPLLRRSARNWPQDAGLAIGLDAGRCNQIFIGDDITLFGPAIVGAVRMVESANAGEMVVNLGLGQRLSDQIEQGVWGDVLAIELTTRHSKEYPRSGGGQEAYLLKVLNPHAVLRASGENLAQVRSALDQLPYDPTDGQTLRRA